MSSVPTSTAAIPKLPESGCHACVAETRPAQGLRAVLQQEGTDGDHDRQHEQPGEQEHSPEHPIRTARRLDPAA
jgi:hypothetical protein